MTLQILVWDSTAKSQQLADWTGLGMSPVFREDEHGAFNYEDFIPMPFHEANYWYELQGLPHVELTNEAGTLVWAGRLEDVILSADNEMSGINVVAFGYQKALTDTKYTAFWSYDKYEGWEQITK